METRKLKPNKVDVQKVEPKIDYQQLEQQRTVALQERLTVQLKAREVGKSQSLRGVVLRYVSEGKYDAALQIIDEYLEIKADYPTLAGRSRLHVIHAKELINAIKTKRNFPNLSQLAMSKQQEILEHAIGHFDELKQTLRLVEGMVKDEAIRDLRATVWVIRTIMYTVITLSITAFTLDFTNSMGAPFWVVFTDFADRTFDFFLGLL